LGQGRRRRLRIAFTARPNLVKQGTDAAVIKMPERRKLDAEVRRAA
jgi:hypothetical protein